MSNCPNCGASEVQASACAYCRTPVAGASDYSRAINGFVNAIGRSVMILPVEYADARREIFPGMIIRMPDA